MVAEAHFQPEWKSEMPSVSPTQNPCLPIQLFDWQARSCYKWILSAKASKTSSFLLILTHEMTFLNPIFLWASLAVLIPIIIHLFNFRRPKRVSFPDISLVKEVKKSVVKRMRLRQWLLLLARCLAILALVFLFANPVWRPNAADVVKGHASVAVILDNSYSMKAGNDKGAYWIQAQALAREIIESHSKTDEFLVMCTDAPRLSFNFGEQQAAVKELRGLEIRQNKNSLETLLGSANDIFANASNQNRRMYFISDFQKSSILSDSSVSFKVPEGIDLNLVPLSTRKLPNAYISEHQVATQIIEAGKPVTLKLTLTNDAPDPIKNVNLRVVLGAENRPVGTEDLAGNSSKVVEVALLPKTSGWQAGYVEIDDYPVEFDNRRYFTFYVPFKENMLVVEGSPAPHLRLMFGGDLINQFSVKFVSAREFAAENIDLYKSIVLSGVTEVPTGMAEKLSTHLKQGRSVMFFPGEKMNVSSVNSFLSSIQVGTFGEFVEAPKGITANSVDLDHPVFEGVFLKGSKQRKFDGPTLYKYYNFAPAAATIQNTILALPSKDPVLVESKLESGLFYTFNFFPGASWTDFTMKSSGLAMMVQIARVMNQTQQVQAAMELGGSETYRIKTQAKDVIRMVGENTELTPEQFLQSGYVVLRFDRQQFPEGNYALKQGETNLEQISFNVPDIESRLAAYDEQTLREYFSERGIEGVEVTPGVQGAISDAVEMKNEGLPLWKYFLAAALLFLFVEFVLLRPWKTNATI